MTYFLIVVLVLLLLLGPQWWTTRVMQRHSQVREDFPGTGGELARHLLDRFQLQSVVVEVTDKGDHYDPMDRVVRLSDDHFNNKSLTAVSVAAHEVGHALQHAQGYGPLLWRTRLARWA